MHSTYNPSRLSRWITIRGPWPTKPQSSPRAMERGNRGRPVFFFTKSIQGNREVLG